MANSLSGCVFKLDKLIQSFTWLLEKIFLYLSINKTNMRKKNKKNFKIKIQKNQNKKKYIKALGNRKEKKQF